MNQGFTRMMGYMSDEVIGRNIADFNRHSSEDGRELRIQSRAGRTGVLAEHPASTLDRPGQRV
ncbi:MAG TPA: hypothetical protein DCF78_06245, partial [Dehalococcoidia bacterium]|nr:hypothetical protein [Dehalococcoidia bacterium]